MSKYKVNDRVNITFLSGPLTGTITKINDNDTYTVVTDSGLTLSFVRDIQTKIKKDKGAAFLISKI